MIDIDKWFDASIMVLGGMSGPIGFCLLVVKKLIKTFNFEVSRILKMLLDLMLNKNFINFCIRE